MLEQQLKNYDERLKTRHKAKAQRTDLMAYSVVALGATIAVPNAAVGAIVHHTTSVIFDATAAVAFNIDFDNAGGNDWGLFVSSSSAFASHLGGASGSTVVVSNASFGPAVNLAAGAAVSSARIFNQGAWFNTGSAAAFASGATGYLGIKFNGDTGTIGVQYAWVKIKFEFTGVNTKATILEWAYQDDGSGIAVGDTGVTAPVPADLPASFSALTLLGIGAVGLGAFRRRRDKALIKMDKKAA